MVMTITGLPCAFTAFTTAVLQASAMSPERPA